MITCKQTSQADDIFLSSLQLRVKYENVSEMWLWRRELGFSQASENS